MSQAKRYNTLRALTQRNELDCSYHAAFYLLASDPELCDKAYSYIDVDGIDFEGLTKNSQNLDNRQKLLLSVAHNLFSWTSETDVTPFDISRMGHPCMEFVCNAIYIAAGEYAVKMQLNSNNHPEIVIDMSRHEKTKLIHKNLDRMFVERSETPDDIQPYDEDLER